MKHTSLSRRRRRWLSPRVRVVLMWTFVLIFRLSSCALCITSLQRVFVWMRAKSVCLKV